MQWKKQQRVEYRSIFDAASDAQLEIDELNCYMHITMAKENYWEPQLKTRHAR